METKKIPTKPDGLYPWAYFRATETGTDLIIPYYYGNKVNLETMEYVEDPDRFKTDTTKDEFSNLDWPDINQLVEERKVEAAFPYKKYDIDLGFIRSMSDTRINKIIKEFKEHGFNVTREAILHNFSAWACDYKSGYRDDANGYHLFTPCGCNPFSLRATTLYESCSDWQETYQG